MIREKLLTNSSRSGEMTKYQKILSGILVLQIVLVGWVFWPKEPTNSQREPLLGDLKVDEIVDLRITDESGKTIHFSKVGQDWTLPETGNYPVDGEKIQNLLDDLVKVNTGSLVAETETSHKQLQVGDETYARKVELGMAGGSQTGFFVGSSAGVSTAHIRKFGDSNVYLTDALTSYELGTTGSGWIDTAYVNVPSTTVNRFVIRNASGELVFEKDASGGWQMQGRQCGWSSRSQRRLTRRSVWITRRRLWYLLPKMKRVPKVSTRS
jgi:hypothetical protein